LSSTNGERQPHSYSMHGLLVWWKE